MSKHRRTLYEEAQDLSGALNDLWDAIARALFVPICHRLGIKVKTRYEQAAPKQDGEDDTPSVVLRKP